MLIISISGTSATKTEDTVINRLNYGAWFEFSTRLITSEDNWYHTFSTKLPFFPRPKPLPNFCFNDTDELCTEITVLIRQIDRIRRDFGVFVNQATHRIEQTIPEFHLTHSPRGTRSWFPLGATILQKVLGTARQKDLALVASHVETLESKTDILTNAFNKHVEQFSSSMQVLDLRLSGAIRGVHSNHEDIIRLKIEMTKEIKSLRHVLLQLQIISLEQQHLILNAERAFDALYAGLVMLVSGRLSPSVLSMDRIEAVANHINSALQSEHPGFHVEMSQLRNFYLNAELIVARRSHTLYLGLKYPITSPASTLKVFNLHTLPIPTKPGSTHATILNTDVEVFGLTSDQQHFAVIAKSDLEACQSNSFNFCPNQLPLTSTSANHCVKSLFFNDKVAIKNTCNFTFLFNTAPSQVLPLYDNKVVLYNIPQYTLQCPSQTHNRKGCAFCFVDIMCKCSFVSQNYFVPASLQKCGKIENKTSSSSHLFPINLAMLSHYFDDKALAHIQSDTLLDHPLEIITPDFNISNDTIDSVLVDDKASHMDLAKVVEKSKHDEIIFKSQTEALLHQHLPNMLSTFPTIMDILTIIATAMSGLSLVGVFLLFARYAKADPLPPLTFNPYTTPRQSPIIPTADNDFWVYIITDFASLFFIVILIITLIYLIIKKYHYTMRCNTTLFLELTDGTTCVTLPLLNLAHCPRFWHVKADSYLSDFKVNGFFVKTLTVDFHGLTLENVFSPQILTPPSSIPLSPITGIVVQRLLKRQFWAFLLLTHKSYSNYLTICPLDCIEPHLHMPNTDCTSLNEPEGTNDNDAELE